MTIFSIKDLLPVSINRAGIKNQLEASQVCLTCEKLIKELNQKALQRAVPISLKNKTLTISVPSSSHAQELLMHQHIIKQKINQHFKETLVERIQYKISF